MTLIALKEITLSKTKSNESTEKAPRQHQTF